MTGEAAQPHTANLAALPAGPTMEVPDIAEAGSLQ